MRLISRPRRCLKIYVRKPSVEFSPKKCVFNPKPPPSHLRLIFCTESSVCWSAQLSLFVFLLSRAWKLEIFSQLRGNRPLCEIKFPPSSSSAFVRTVFKSQSLWAKFKSYQRQSTRVVAVTSRANERNLSYNLMAAINANYVTRNRFPRRMECECSQLTI